MTSLTFAIEAHKRGCPYVTLGPKGEPRSLIWGYVPRVEKLNEAQRFAFGATLALWWDEHLQTTKVEADYPLCVRYASDARSFAKGL